MTALLLIFSAVKVLQGLSIVRCPVQMTGVCVCVCVCARTHVRVPVHAYACARACFIALGSLNELTMIPYLDLLRQTLGNFYVEG